MREKRPNFTTEKIGNRAVKNVVRTTKSSRLHALIIIYVGSDKKRAKG